MYTLSIRSIYDFEYMRPLPCFPFQPLTTSTRPTTKRPLNDRADISQILAFMVGFATQNIHYTLWILLGGTAVTFVVCVPPWPFYNKDPVKWLPSKKTNGVSGLDITVDGKKVQ